MFFLNCHNTVFAAFHIVTVCFYQTLFYYAFLTIIKHNIRHIIYRNFHQNGKQNLLIKLADAPTLVSSKQYTNQNSFYFDLYIVCLEVSVGDEQKYYLALHHFLHQFRTLLIAVVIKKSFCKFHNLKWE